MADTNLALDDGSLVDLLDRLVDTGLVADGTVLITLAGVDLIRLDLRLLLASVQSLSRSVPAGPGGRPLHRQHGLRDPDGRPRRPAMLHVGAGPTRSPVDPVDPVGAPSEPDRPTVGYGHRLSLVENLDRVGGAARARELGRSAVPDRPADPAAGVAGLVVTVVDIVRQLLERQALRRMDAGTLDRVQIERLGLALEALERQVQELSELLGTRRSAGSTDAAEVAEVAEVAEAAGASTQPALPTLSGGARR